MGFWKTFFGGEEANPEEEKKNAEAWNFDLLKYDGVKAMRMGQFDYAEKCFTEALKLTDDLETRDYLQQTLVHAGRLDEALLELKTIVAKAPDSIPAMLQAAQVAFMLEDYDEMKQLCDQAMQVDGNNAGVHYFYAKACLGQGDAVGGIAHLTQATHLDENMANARLLRAQTLLTMGDVKGAAEDCGWLMEQLGDNEDVLLLAARVASAEGKADEALYIYNKVVELNPFQIDAYRERGKIRFDQGDKQGAEEDMQKVLELNPQEMADVNGDYSAEGIERQVKRAYSNLNPFGF